MTKIAILIVLILYLGSYAFVIYADKINSKKKAKNNRVVKRVEKSDNRPKIGEFMGDYLNGKIELGDL